MGNSPAVILPSLKEFIHDLNPDTIPGERRELLQEFINYLRSKNLQQGEINLNFICTHNSRRSQFAQIWAQTAAAFFGIDLKSFSGGVEITAFNPRAVESLKRSGFEVSAKPGENPVYEFVYSSSTPALKMFSKIYDDPKNPSQNFAAVMTCSHADENCPFIPGAEKRIALNYEDPKEFDDTSVEKQKYDERNQQIANEMFYVFSKI